MIKSPKMATIIISCILCFYIIYFMQNKVLITFVGIWLYHENYLITSYFDNSPKSPSFSQRVTSPEQPTRSRCYEQPMKVPSLKLSGLVSDCSPCLSSLPGLLALPWTCQVQAHLKAYAVPAPSSWNVLLPDILREHPPSPLVPCLEEPHLICHLICTPTPRSTSKSCLTVSLYIDLCYFPIALTIYVTIT